MSASFASQIARALAAAHQHGIVHGDIKPENILQRHDGYIKVLDFGLAHRVMAEGTSRTGRPGFGTMRYMSPEQARGEPLTSSSDIVSLGLVLFELAAGQHPFARQSPAEAMNFTLHHALPPPASVNPRIPAALNSPILTMLAKEPGRRPTAAQAAERLDSLVQARARAGRRFWLVGAVATSLAAAVIAGWLHSRPRNPPQFANLRIEPLTSQDGWEAAPSFSPDGKTVAFTWTPSLETAPQIYLKRDNDSAPVELTDPRAQGSIGYPVWSPDGKWIAFKRVFDSSAGIFAFPAAGGEQKKLADLRVKGLSNVIDWSPDGDHLAFADLVSNSDRRLAIFILNLRTGEKRRLTTPVSVEFADWNPLFSPDGRSVAFKRVGGFWDDAMYVAPLSGGEARRVTWQGGGIGGHAWSRDGKSLIVSCQRGGTVFGLWRFPLDGGPPERIIQGGSDAIAPALAWKTGRLAWVNQNEDINIYRVTATGGEPPRSLIASTARDRAAACSPDGTIAFVSDRSGAREIWLARADGSDQHRVTSFNGPDVDNLAWSPDGQRLAFYARVKGHSDIFTLDCDAANRRCGEPRPTISGIKAQAPGWSRDGKFLYFASDRTGRFEVWREPAAGGPPVQITYHAGFMARESPDGKWLYFSKDGDGTLWRMRLPLDLHSGSSEENEEQILGPPFNVQPTAWTVLPDEIIFADVSGKALPGALRGYRISTRVPRVILPSLPRFADNRNYSVTVSSDSKWILFSQLDRSGSNIMLADNH